MNKPESISEEMLSAYLDDELTSSERDRVTDELERDAELRAVLAELQQIRDDIRGLPRHVLSADFASRITQQAQTSQRAHASGKEDIENVARRDNSLAASRQRIVLGTLATAATILLALWAVGPNRTAPIAKAPATNETEDLGRLPIESSEGVEMLAESINVETQPESMAVDSMAGNARKSFGLGPGGDREMMAADEMAINSADAPTEKMSYALDARQPQQAPAEDLALQAQPILAFEPSDASAAARGGIAGGGFAGDATEGDATEGDATAGVAAADAYPAPATISMDDSREVPPNQPRLYSRSLAQEHKTISPGYDAIYRLEVAETEWDNRLRSYRGRTHGAGLAKAESMTPDSTARQEGEVTRMVVLEGTVAEIQNSLSSLQLNVPTDSFFESVAIASPPSRAKQQPRFSGNSELQRIPIGKGPSIPRARFQDRSKYFDDATQTAEGEVPASNLAAAESPLPKTARPMASDASAVANGVNPVIPGASTPATGGRSETNAAAFIIPKDKAESDNGIAVNNRQLLLDRQRDFGNASPGTETRNEALARGIKAGGIKASGQETRYRVLLVITPPASDPADAAPAEQP